ncbi:MAG: MFS transporter [Tannerellaceae bacterium]
MNNWKTNLSIIWIGQIISLLTSTTVGYSAIFWISLETKSPEVLAYAFLAGNLPQIILGLFAGVYIDRWNRKWVMILADLFIATCTLLLSRLLISGNHDLEYLYILFACRSIGSSFHAPALQASIPLLVPESQLTRVSGINQSIQSISGILAPVIGATLIAFFRIEYVLLLDVAGAILACISLLFIYIPPQKRISTDNKLWREIKECFSVINTTIGLPALFIGYTFTTFVIMPIAVLFPFITIDHFGGNSFQMGLIEMIWGIGALTGGLMLAANRKQINNVIMIHVSYLILGIYLVISGLLPSWGFPAFACITIVGGITYALYNALFVAIIQQNISAEILGRVFSLFFSLSVLPSMIGILASGYLAEVFGVTTIFVLGGIGISLSSIATLFLPSIKTLRNGLKPL